MSVDAPRAWEPGGPSPNPGGKKPLPAWLKGKDDELLRLQYDVVMTGRMPVAPDPDVEPQIADDGTEVPQGSTVEVPVALRLEALERLISRIRGRPAITTDGDGGGGVNEFLMRVADRLAGGG